MERTETDKQKRIEELFSAGAHYGYTRKRRHPSMAPVIFGAKNRVEIFDLERVTAFLDEACAYAKELGGERKTLLFVGGKQEIQTAVQNAARSVDAPYVTGRWIGGTLTNFQEIKKRIDRLGELREQREKGALDKYTKREQLDFDREIEDLSAHFDGIASLTKLPDALFVIDTNHEAVAVAEAKGLHIPVIGILNSDCDMADAFHPIPANDASLASVSFLVSEVTKAYQEGLSQPKPAGEEEKKPASTGASQGGEEAKATK